MKDNKFLIGILIIGLLVFITNVFIFQICIVHGISMEPTLKNKGIVFINKIDKSIKRNDIIVIKKNNKIIIKRVIGLPNDIIKIENYAYVNNEQFDNLYIENCGTNNNVKLKYDEYYVLGDNRQNSIDSRFDEIGIINREEIIGKVL